MKKIPLTDLEYVEVYANKLLENSILFSQHKKLINSQIIFSRELFEQMFGVGREFKTNARIYLKEIGLI